MNGYTGIFDNGSPTFAEFVWRCARAFGALIHMRDCDWNAPLQMSGEEERGGYSYYKEGLARAKKDLQRYEKMTLAQAQDILDREYRERQREVKETIVKKRALKLRVDSMLVQVQAWTVPTPEHNGLKEFMVEQLEAVIKHDCDLSYSERTLAEPKTTAKEWLKNHIEWEKQDVKRYTEEVNKEGGAPKANDWIRALQKSVPNPR
jgi:hypothetical protein